jgi:hypothetical protein
MRWVEHVARMGERRATHRVMVEKGKGNNLQNLGVDGSIILDWILKKSVERAG